MIRRTLAILLVLALPAWGAMEFNGSTEKAVTDVAEVTAAPFTVCAWGNTANITDTQTIFSLGNSTPTNDRFEMLWRGAIAGDPIFVEARENGGTAGSVDTTTGYSASTWHLSCYVEVSSASRSAFIDGGSEGTDTTSSTPAGIDRTLVATLQTSSGQILFFDGAIAEVGIWNAALTDGEVATLAKSFAPPCVRRNALVAYYPMVRDATSLKDLFSGTANHLTLTGGTVSGHPSITNCQ